MAETYCMLKDNVPLRFVKCHRTLALVTVLRYLSLGGDSLVEASQNFSVPTLRARGVEVTF